MGDRYVGKDNYGRPRGEYVSALAAMDDTALGKAVADMVWLSAYATNNPRSDYHWQCDACYDECQRRGKPEIYKGGYAVAFEAATGRKP